MLDRSGEYLVATPEGVVKTPYEPRRSPVEEQWDMNELEAIRGTPWKPVPSRDGDLIPTGVKMSGQIEESEDKHLEREIAIETTAEDPDSAPKEKKNNKFPVREGHIRQFGHTDGCQACEVMRRGRVKTWQHHSEACRDRIMERIMSSGTRQSKERVTKSLLRDEYKTIEPERRQSQRKNGEYLFQIKLRKGRQRKLK